MNGLENYAKGNGGAVAFSVLCILALSIYIALFVIKISPHKIFHTYSTKTLGGIGKHIKGREDRFNRDYAVGLITKRRAKYKSYRFLNDLTIDLGLKVKGVTPYELLFLVLVSGIVLSLAIGLMLFSSLVLGVLAFPIITAGVICWLYTRANLSHDRRIEAVTEAENILSNNITNGIVVSVRQTLDSLPREVVIEFRDFLNAIDDNTYIETALLDLNNKLGSISDDFIQKCIELMLEEEHGTAGMFQDVVELNNIKSQLRFKMKKSFEVETRSVMIIALMLTAFLIGVIAIFPFVRNFYFNNIIGQLIILIDILILIGEFVYITVLRAQPL